MKRISTLCAVLISGLALAQGPGAPLMAPKKVNMNQVTNNPAHPVGGISNRLTAFTDDFSTPSNWTMTNASSPSYDWEIVTSLPSNLSSFGSTLNSTSGGNFALVNSDNQGQTATQDCNLTTASSFDCSGNATVQVRFQNYHKIYLDHQYVSISTDGVNFTDTEVNTNYGSANQNYVASPNAEEIAVNVSSMAAGNATVWLRFHYTGAWDWFWAIDDINVEDAPNDELIGQLFTMSDQTPSYVFGDRIEHTIVPASQVTGVRFIGDLLNNGANVTTNAKMDVDVQNSSSSSVFTQSSTAADLAVTTTRMDSLDWAATTTQDTYTVNFLANFDNYPIDPNQGNNDGMTSYSVVPSTGPGAVYGRDNNTYTGSGLWNGDATGYIMGVEYSMYANATAYGIDVAFTPNTDPNATVCAILYQEDPNGASVADVMVPLQDNCLDGLDVTLSANDISASPNIVWKTFPFPSPVSLTAGTAYVAAINYYGGVENAVIMNGGSTTRGAATVWLYDSPNATWYYMTSKPMIRLNLDNTVSVNEQEMYNLTLFQNRPNPTNGVTTFQYMLEQSAEVNFEIVDLTGKLVYSTNEGTMSPGQHMINLNTNELSAGVYYYSVSAGTEKITKKMMVTK